jgi:hypothetical protein
MMKKEKKTWTATNERDGSEVYRGTSETDAARAARKAAEDNARRQSLAPANATVFCEGARKYYYTCDPTMGRMKAQKIFYA